MFRIIGIFSYETNDDFVLSCFVDGAISEKSARMVYINVIIGTLLKGLYTLIPAVSWYSLFQYAMLFASFTAMTWILLQRWKLIPALALSIGLISIFGLDSYIIVQYTKTTAVATVSGILLMFYSLGEEKGTKSRRTSMTIGVILALYMLDNNRPADRCDKMRRRGDKAQIPPHLRNDQTFYSAPAAVRRSPDDRQRCIQRPGVGRVYRIQ